MSPSHRQHTKLKGASALITSLLPEALDNSWLWPLSLNSHGFLDTLSLQPHCHDITCIGWFSVIM